MWVSEALNFGMYRTTLIATFPWLTFPQLDESSAAPGRGRAESPDLQLMLFIDIEDRWRTATAKLELTYFADR